MSYTVIFAGGTGSRMHNPTPKQFLEVHGKPVIVHTIEQFQRHSMIHTIGIVEDSGEISGIPDRKKCYALGELHVLEDEGVNFKITAPADLELMRILWPSWQKGTGESQ